MQDIRFLGLEGDNLLLETESGEQFKLAIDESLRRLIKKDTKAVDQENQISPRDIQIEIRSGVSIQDLAERTGASVDYIEKFAATVIDELQHVIASALAVRIQVPGDRFNEPIHAEFGEVISERLSKNRATGVSWTSRKDESGTWVVQCNFKTNSGLQEAIWSFDLRKLVLSPENDTALQLQTQAPLSTTSKPTSAAAKPKVADEPLVATGSIQKPKTVKPPVTEPTILVPVESETSSIEIGNLATTTDLTDILKRRAAEAAANEPTKAEPEASAPEVTETEEIAETKVQPIIDLEATQPIEPAPKKGRVPVQSWEEILLSTRSEDDQAN